MSPERPAGMDKLLTDARIITGIVLTAAIIIAALTLMMIGHPEHIETTTLGLLLGAALTLTGLATWSSISASRAAATARREDADRVAATRVADPPEGPERPTLPPAPVDPLLGPPRLPRERWRDPDPDDALGGGAHGEAGAPDASPHPPEGERGE